MSISLRICIILLSIFWVQLTFAQNNTQLIQAEYKIRYRDTTGTYLQVINYFDRSYYKYNIYLKEKLPNGSGRYAKMKIDTATGLGLIPERAIGKRNVQINRCLEIKDVTIKKNAINRIEIRNEKGFLNIFYPNPIANQQTTTMIVVNTYTKDSFQTEVPTALSLPQGKFEIIFKVHPKLKRTIYVKPSKIIHKRVYRSIPVKFNGLSLGTSIKVHKWNYTDKTYSKIYSGVATTDNPIIYFLPKTKYKIYYKRKEKRRSRSAVFYTRANMKEFILTMK